MQLIEASMPQVETRWKQGRNNGSMMKRSWATVQLSYAQGELILRCLFSDAAMVAVTCIRMAAWQPRPAQSKPESLCCLLVHLECRARCDLQRMNRNQSVAAASGGIGV